MDSMNAVCLRVRRQLLNLPDSIRVLDSDILANWRGNLRLNFFWVSESPWNLDAIRLTKDFGDQALLMSKSIRARIVAAS